MTKGDQGETILAKLRRLNLTQEAGKAVVGISEIPAIASKADPWRLLGKVVSNRPVALGAVRDALNAAWGGSVRLEVLYLPVNLVSATTEGLTSRVE